MIEFNEVFCEDLKDDFEELGRNQKNFTLNELIQNDLSRAFAFGYCFRNWIKEGMWFPVPVRKAIRHLSDGLESYNSQLKWINEKFPLKDNDNKVKVSEYANYLLDNIFCDNPDELLKLTIILGSNMSNNE